MSVSGAAESMRLTKYDNSFSFRGIAALQLQTYITLDSLGEVAVSMIQSDISRLRPEVQSCKDLGGFLSLVPTQYMALHTHSTNSLDFRLLTVVASKTPMGTIPRMG